MLKFFYKVILVSLMSGSLILMDFNYAYAETVQTGVESKSDIASTLTMTVVGTLASRLYKYTPPTIDIMLAAAGGALFLAGEVLAYLKLKDSLKSLQTEITRDSDGNINKEQVATLERLKKSYQDAKGTAQTKKMLQTAAAAAFAAAGIAAATMAVGDTTALTTCSAAITTNISAVGAVLIQTCNPLIAGTYTAAAGAACATEVSTCEAAMTAYSKLVVANEFSRQASGPSATGIATVTGERPGLATGLAAVNAACPLYTTLPAKALTSACTPLLPNNVKGESGGVGFTTPLLEAQNNFKQYFSPGINENKIANNYFLKALDFIFPSAHAELFSAMGIASGAAIAYIMATSAVVGPYLDLFMLIPMKRATVWAAMTLTAYTAMGTTDKVISDIEANIQKIDNILKTMYSNADGTTTNQVATTNTATLTAAVSTSTFSGVNYSDTTLNNGDSIVTLPCSTGTAKPCKSLSDVAKSSQSFSGFDSQTQMQLGEVLKAADGVNGTSTISKGTLESASKLAGTANALRSSLAKAQAATSEALKKSGSKYDLTAEAKKVSDTLAKDVSNQLKKSNSTADQMLASMYGGSASASSGKDTATTKTAAVDTKKEKVQSANVVDISASTTATQQMDLGLGKTADTNAQAVANNEALKAATSMDSYDLKNDITKDSSSSIFELISNRYQKSGYPRLFKLKETNQ
jgi:hypothetical protein